MRKKELIKASNISKSFGPKHVLRNVSFSVNEGDAIAMMGANGAGKTTFVEILCGLNKPPRGTVKYNLGSNFKKKIGIQFQESVYPPGVKVRHLIDFYVDIYKKSHSGSEYHLRTFQSYFNDLMDALGIKKLLNRDITKLSGGELQRINICLAIVNRPEVVFFDEISTGLDINAKIKVIDLIRDLKEKYNLTIVVITHNVEDIARLCNRICVLSNGKIVIDEKTEAILKKYGSYENFVDTEFDTMLKEVEEPRRLQPKGNPLMRIFKKKERIGNR